jgi:hypothetical protein
METPGSSARSLLPAASGPPRKRAAGEAGTATRKQRVLDEEEYIEVRPQCECQRLPGPSVFSYSSPVPALSDGSVTTDSLHLGCGKS